MYGKYGEGADERTRITGDSVKKSILKELRGYLVLNLLELITYVAFIVIIACIFLFGFKVIVPYSYLIVAGFTVVMLYAYIIAQAYSVICIIRKTVRVAKSKYTIVSEKLLSVCQEQEPVPYFADYRLSRRRAGGRLRRYSRGEPN